MIPTAEEFLQNHSTYSGFELESIEDDVIQTMIEFAKLHVQEALKLASENATIINHVATKDDDRVYKEVSKNSILNAYPLDNIK